MPPELEESEVSPSVVVVVVAAAVVGVSVVDPSELVDAGSTVEEVLSAVPPLLDEDEVDAADESSSSSIGHPASAQPVRARQVTSENQVQVVFILPR